MNHSDMEELLSAYSNGELPRAQREFVEGHLAGCEECRRELDTLPRDGGPGEGPARPCPASLLRAGGSARGG